MPSLGSHRLRGFAPFVLALACAGCASSPAPSAAAIARDGGGRSGNRGRAGEPAASPTRPPSRIPRRAPDVIVTQDFEPPAPLCPGPLGQVDPPGVRVRIADGQPIAATMGSSGSRRARRPGSTTSATSTYPAPLVALADDELTFAVDPGWHILWFEEFDHPKRGDGGNMTPGVRVAGGPAEVSIPVPAGPGT